MSVNSFDLGAATWVSTLALTYGLSRRIGAGEAASAVGAVSVATLAAKMIAPQAESQSAGFAGLDQIRLSLNVGEVVLFPLAAGLALALSAGPERKKDAAVLLSTAALGAGASYAVIASASGK